MHCQIAESEASTQQKPSPRGCRVKRRKFKKRNEARYQQKWEWRTILLQKEFKELAAENTYLKEAIECLLANYLQVPARDPQKEENNVSLSATQLYDPNLYVQLDGLELDDLLDEEIPISKAIQQNATMGEFLMKIDDDVASNVDFPDCTYSLEGEQKRVGRYNFPLALVPTVERIINVYGDISTGCLINSNAAGQIYIFLCATIKEMEEVELHKVTEEKMLKWRDAIKDAHRINFKVEFAIDHLKKIARAYFGRKGSQALHDIDEKLDALYKERVETYEVFKDCLAEANAFHGKIIQWPSSKQSVSLQNRILHLGNMEDTRSEATSPYSTSEMAYSSMYDQSNDTYQWNFRQQITEAMTHSQENRKHVLQGEPSEVSHQSTPGNRRPKMSEAEKKRRKRQIDAKYRQSKKDEMELLSSENRHQKLENERLTLENERLKEHIRGQQGKKQRTEEVLERQDSCITQSISQVDNQGAYVQYHLQDPHQWVDDSNNEGAIYGFDGLEMNDLQSLLLSENEMIRNGGIAINEPTAEHPESSQTASCHAEMAKTKFLMKLDEEVVSNVDSSDFTGLGGERRKVGRYSFPLSLIPTVERIRHVYGDISAPCLISPSASGEIYVLFCAMIKEMDDLRLEEITENKMLKWRDVIKDALRLKFNVQFAMEHLKKIACAYFGSPGRIVLQDIDAKISKLEAEVNDWKKERAKIYEESKLSVDAAEKFTGVPVSQGLFRLSCCNT
ncbi:hypothetical protein CCACVL1_24487 [Corchorus capsularis]|uniref:BZIP domain-containing protein n=1 Tax=Corchorus capsularis TaxID=210143 RepID=A0A1R3GPE5_COCAP|nr:hypothetical protein CCACVL1_24487 [Corchorus capsularis]